MRTFIIAVAVACALDVACGFINDASGESDKPLSPWQRAATRATSLLFALWGAALIGANSQ